MSLIPYSEEDVQHIPEDVLEELIDDDKVNEYLLGEAIMNLPDTDDDYETDEEKQ